MVTVTTKEELELALKNKEAYILIKGDLAKLIKKKRKIKKTAMLTSVALLAVGVALIPFTGGSSMLPTMGFVYTSAAGSVLSISAGEFAMISGILALGLGTVCVALLKEYSFEYTSDGDIKLTHKKS